MLATAAQRSHEMATSWFGRSDRNHADVHPSLGLSGDGRLVPHVEQLGQRLQSGHRPQGALR
jgi:hypothetical protein